MVHWIQVDPSLTEKKRAIIIYIFLGRMTTANIAFSYCPEVCKGSIYLNNFIIHREKPVASAQP